MRIYISYFYQLRFFPKNAIALSTAKYDPKWFHNWQGNDHVFVDKRGVINGLRAEEFNCSEETVNHLTEIGEMCHPGCYRERPCKFMQLYEQELDRLDLDYVLKHFEIVAEKLKIDDPIFILLVHESPTVLCAERPIIQKWFAKHGIDVQEWRRDFGV